MRGFITISWMLQTCLCSLFAVLAFALFSQWQKKLSRMHNNIQHILPLPMAIASLRKDSFMVSKEHMSVKSNELYLYLPDQQKKIRWYLHDDKLMRQAQSYDQKKKKWSKPIHNVTAAEVKSINFESIGDSHDLMGIIFTINSGCTSPYTARISLRNGRVL